MEKEWGSLGRIDVSVVACAEREVATLHAAFKLEQGLGCFLMLFSGWIIFGEFKARPSCVSGLVSGITSVNWGTWALEDQQATF